MLGEAPTARPLGASKNVRLTKASSTWLGGCDDGIVIGADGPNCCVCVCCVLCVLLPVLPSFCRSASCFLLVLVFLPFVVLSFVLSCCRVVLRVVIVIAPGVIEIGVYRYVLYCHPGTTSDTTDLTD